MNRRTFLRYATATTACAVAGLETRPAEQAAAPAASYRPNFLVILADDMGFSDLGCYGSEIRTPNLDRLAAEGLRFTQGYNCARCCPSRASLLTGLYPHEAGVGKIVSFPDGPEKPGPYQGYLNDRCATLAELLRAAGYRTYMSGKWHVGEMREHWPRRRGFDRYFGLISGGSSYWELLEEPGRKRVMAQDDEPFTPEPGEFYMTDAFSDFAVRCLREHAGRDEPFLLYLAYTAPHWPLHAWPEDIARYEGTYRIGWDELRRRRYTRQLELGIIDPQWALSPRDGSVPAWEDVEYKPYWKRLMAVYAAMIDRMDYGIGRVLQVLDETGAAENTVVVFLSDNGGCDEDIAGRKLHTPGTRAGERGSYDACKRPWANASNTPFRLYKKYIHEGGIATPFIVRWPRAFPRGGQLTREVAHITDIMPTCLDASGAVYPETFAGRALLPLAGRSLLPALRGESREPRPALFWEHFGNRGVRQDDWKYVATARGDWELYNLAEDRTELRSLGAEQPEKARELDALYAAWAGRVGV